jgi:cell division protease FtsH
VSEATHRLVDEEVRRIVEEAEQETVLLLERERHRLTALAGALLERETLDQADAYEIAGVEQSPVEVPDAGATVAPRSPAP